MTYILNLSATERVAAYPEQTSYDFEEIVGYDYGLYVTAAGYGTRSAVYGVAATPLQKDLERLAGNFLNVELRERAITLYLGLLGYVANPVQLQGYSQGEWLRGVIFQKRHTGITEDQIRECLGYAAENADAWFKGDIYEVNRERLETYVNVNDVSDTVTKWVSIDGYSGFVISDPSDLIQIACDEFQIPKLDWRVTYE
jgi:hypothetical protein